MKTPITPFAAALAAGLLCFPAIAQQDLSPFSWTQIAPREELPQSFLGIRFTDVATDTVAELDLPAERGILVRQVVGDSPAEAAELQENDVIIEWNEVRVESARQFKRLVAETPPDRTVGLTVIRDGDTRDLEATVGRSDDMAFADPGSTRMQTIPPHSFHPSLPFQVPFPFQSMPGSPPRLGVELQELTVQLADFFGLDGGTGVLVAGVLDDTPAAEAGLRAGDVIIAVDGRDVDSIPSVQRAVSEAGDAVELTIVRDREETTLKTTLRDLDEQDDEPDVRELVIPSEDPPVPAPRFPKQAL